VLTRKLAPGAFSLAGKGMEKEERDYVSIHCYRWFALAEAYILQY